MINQKIQDYLDSKIDIEELILFFDTYNKTDEEIKTNGIVYTPKSICDFIVKKMNLKINRTILEPSVGHGMFLFSILKYMEEKYELRANALFKYMINYIKVQDTNEKSIEDLGLIINAFFKKRGLDFANGVPNKIGDTLKNNENERYDYIIGNPPYIRTQNLSPEYLSFLRKNYKSCEKGNIDIYYAFIEYAISQCYDQCALIVPNSWITNDSARNLRKIIKEDLKELIDFKTKKIFKNADTYTSILFIDKRYRESMAISDIMESDKIVYSNGFQHENLYLQERKELSDKAWFFNKEKINLGLKEVNFHSPIATLRDKIYISEIPENKDFVLFNKISKIKSENDFFAEMKAIIFPYTYNVEKNKYEIKKEEELDPDTLSYLEKNKEELNKRDKGKTSKYEAWYAYGRKQGLNVFKKNKELIIVPGMISLDYKFFSINSNKIKQPFLFSSGFMIEVLETDKDKALNFLNSVEFKNYLKKNGKVWKGKTEEESYYSLSIKQIKEIIV